MCLFCAAIPMAASLGTASAGKQLEKRRECEARGEVPPKVLIPAGKATPVIVVGLLVSSAIYHTILMPRIGI